ncbi:MAG: hypothetical protein HY548_00390, partial [Elusimicrobia bacterium]|nr:hypothetical protein [Elusimicrobiota bacterium]
MRQWEMLYERQPLHLDALLLALALMLHLPLLTLHMPAPKKAKGKAGKLVNIDYIEQQIQKRKEQPVVLPPKMPDPPKQIQDMVKKVENEVKKQIFQRSLPPPPPPKPKIQETIIQGPQATKLQEKLLQDKLNQNQNTLQNKGAFQG